MTKESFLEQLSSVNAQWLNIQNQIASFEMSGKEDLKDQYISSVRLNIEIMHATMSEMIRSLSKEDVAELPSYLVGSSKTLSANIFKLCGDNYRKEYIDAKEERKNKLEESRKSETSFCELNNRPL